MEFHPQITVMAMPTKPVKPVQPKPMPKRVEARQGLEWSLTDVKVISCSTLSSLMTLN